MSPTSRTEGPGGPVAVVLGLRENGLGVVRALGREGVRVIAVEDGADRHGSRTRYAREVASRDFLGPGVFDTLDEIAEGLPEPPVLIPTMDQHVVLLSANRERIDGTYRHSLPAPAVIDALMDKGATREYAEAHGFLMPESHELTTAEQLEACMETLSPPYILKPQSKTVAFFRYSPRKVYFTRSKDELREAFRLLSQWHPGVVVQEWVPGPDRNLVFVLFYFDEDSRPLASFTGRKIRQYIPYCGTGCSAEPWTDDHALEEGLRFFREIGYTGYAAIEFKISDRDGRYHLVEPSVGRTEHLFALAAANGINLPYIGYRHMAGLPRAPLTPVSTPVRYVYWKNDFKSAVRYIRDGNLTVREWLHSLRGPKQHGLFAWDDLKPYLAWRVQPLRRLPRGAARRILRKGREVRESSARASHAPPPNPVHDNPTHNLAALDWLCRAQDATGGGGVARGYTIVQKGVFPPGWQPAYPETTGYIIPTFLDAAVHYRRPDLRERAFRMADWEVEVQLSDGGIPGGVLGEVETPVVFNTGQVMLGWCRALEEGARGEVRTALERAAAFLVGVQDEDGGWRRFTNKDGLTTVHAYDVRNAWALLWAHRLIGEPSFREAALRNLEFTLELQQPNGWFRSNALTYAHNARPLTHTIAYATRGILESGMILDDERFVRAARTTADAVLARVRPDGHLAGELAEDWSEAASWCCLTGSAQMSIVWLKLFRLTGDGGYREAAARVNRYLKATQDLRASDDGIRGGIAGPYPVDRGYCRYQMLNWATKFFVDALMLEEVAEAAPERAEATVP